MQPWRLIVIRDAGDAQRGARARPARAAAPGRPLRRARPPVPRPEDRGRRRGAARDLRLLRPRRPRRGDPRARRRSPRPTSTARPARSRTCGWRPAPRASASAGSASTGPTDLRALLGLPERADPIAYLCLGWPDERPVRPGLEAAGWSARLPLEAVVMDERWRERRRAAGVEPRAAASARTRRPRRAVPGPRAAIAARDRSDELVKPAGSLGALEVADRALGADHRSARRRSGCAPACSSAPPITAIVAHGTSLFDARGLGPGRRGRGPRRDAPSGVLARRGGHELLVADVGLAAPTPPGVRDVKVARGTRRHDRRPGADARASSRRRSTPARRSPRELAETRRRLPRARRDRDRQHDHRGGARRARSRGASPQLAVGRGDRRRRRRPRAQARDRVERARSAPRRAAGAAATRCAASAGSSSRRSPARRSRRPRLRLPVLLDGYAVAAAALAAVQLDPRSARR